MSRLFPVLIVLLLPVVAVAQPWVTANPKAVHLRTIATAQGRQRDAHVGDASGGVGDLDKDGYGDFLLHSLIPAEWRLYHGGSTIRLDTTWKFETISSVPDHPLIGNFTGTRQQHLGLGQYHRDDSTFSHYWLYLFPIDSNNGRIASEPSMIWDSWRENGNLRNDPDEILVSDLDGDGADEIVMFFCSEYTIEPRNRISQMQIWIYKGGSNFTLSAPTVILRDTLYNQDHVLQASIADLDGDHHLDIVMNIEPSQTAYPGHWRRVRVFWGHEGFPRGDEEPEYLGMIDSYYVMALLHECPCRYTLPHPITTQVIG